MPAHATNLARGKARARELWASNRARFATPDSGDTGEQIHAMKNVTSDDSAGHIEAWQKSVACFVFILHPILPAHT